MMMRQSDHVAKIGSPDLVTGGQDARIAHDVDEHGALHEIAVVPVLEQDERAVEFEVEGNKHPELLMGIGEADAKEANI